MTRHGKTASSADRADTYARVTQSIIAAIEAGPGTWRMPWHHDGAAVTRPINVASGKAYRGINVVSLWAAAQAAGYASGLWGTYRQWQALGAQVRKGETASLGVLWKELRRGEDPTAESDGDQDRPRLFARAFSLFNCDQVDDYGREAKPTLPESERLANAETFITNLGIETIFGGSQAYYQPSADRIHMPAFAHFRDAASFYGVWLHEAGHGSGAKHRLDRDLTGRFGSAAYAAEECCVEILSGFILADLGIAHHPRPDHAAYIATWVELLKHDPRAIFTAASKAQQAADWMHARQQPVDEA